MSLLYSCWSEDKIRASQKKQEKESYLLVSSRVGMKKELGLVALSVAGGVKLEESKDGTKAKTSLRGMLSSIAWLASRL